MGEVEPRTRPPGNHEANQIVEDWEREVGPLPTNHPLKQLREAVRRLSAIQAYCTTGTQTEVTRDVAAMAATGGWASPH